MAVWDGLGFKSFDIIQASFDVIDVAFDNTLIALFTRVQPAAAPSLIRVVMPATPTYTRV